MERVPAQIASGDESVERRDERLIVEIGCGEQPFLQDASDEYRERFKNNPALRYIGVDISEEALRTGREVSRQVDVRRGNATADRLDLVRASAESLPFADDSAEEVVLRNVLGDPDIDVEVKQRAIGEAVRILRTGGALRVIEQYTPMLVHIEDTLHYIRNLHGGIMEELTQDEENELPSHEKETDVLMTRHVKGVSYELSGTPFVARFRKKESVNV